VRSGIAYRLRGLAAARRPPDPTAAPVPSRRPPKRWLDEHIVWFAELLGRNGVSFKETCGNIHRRDRRQRDQGETIRGCRTVTTQDAETRIRHKGHRVHVIPGSMPRTPA